LRVARAQPARLPPHPSTPPPSQVCFRTLDLYTSAVLESSLDPAPPPKPEFRAAMAAMSTSSCDAYRAVVRGDPRFIDFFSTATPVNELGRMNIGSRPAKRRAAGSIDALRAIPWIFAWTQTRSERREGGGGGWRGEGRPRGADVLPRAPLPSFHLPVWLGVGDAFRAEEAAGKLPLLQQMYREWPFFRVTLDMLEMVFAKADPRVSRYYVACLVAPELHPFSELLLTKFFEAREAILKVAGHRGVLSDAASAVLQQKLALREPYVTPLNVLQVRCLKALRALEAGEPAPVGAQCTPADPAVAGMLARDPGAAKNPYLTAVEDTVIITMKGISAGMQNTG